MHVLHMHMVSDTKFRRSRILLVLAHTVSQPRREQSAALPVPAPMAAAVIAAAQPSSFLTAHRGSLKSCVAAAGEDVACRSRCESAWPGLCCDMSNYASESSESLSGAVKHARAAK